MNGGVEGSCIIAVSSTNVVGTKIGRNIWNLHWSINVETEAESMDKGTEPLEAEGVTMRGMGFGNVRSNSD